MSKEDNEYIISCKDSSCVKSMNSEILFLARHVMNKRIIDCSRKNLNRINDLEIGILPSGAYLIACSVGLSGLFRKLKIEKAVKFLLKTLGKKIPSKLVSWQEIEKVDFFRGGIKFSRIFPKILNLHQSDIR